LDLNSFLIEGKVVSTTEEECDSGYWIELASKYRDCSSNIILTEIYQVKVLNTKQYPSCHFEPGANIRIVGCIRRNDQRGLFVLAEVLEKRNERKVMKSLEEFEASLKEAT